ncbi:phosphoinositide phosphatase SAC6 [Physcomitrium patens]|uniref:SAC domain-containing protein n=1 Tax=Physcomitrium patens TaxID=3218 RepID=A0A2K1KWP7_PHYPA|nr:phosphoinositide phosphatase SAC6-like [Physcomitrium patens]XP_024372045.1 phosphoinositide phosphatase SAC6-like [Physcomitrium patens]PNR58203.1 hypothetical protein PHYPA_005198 [Physcomitrium patens]|eukprot:XP_024372044.1 phosphoinositide phosphatase SAC6-like [Physcomitrella patens]
MGLKMDDFSEIQKRSTRMRLWELPDVYVLEPTDSMATQFLSINRSTGDLSYTSQLPDSDVPHAQIVFGLAGILRLVAGTYAVVITGRQSMGTYRGHSVYRVSSLRVLPCNNNLHRATPEEKKEEAYFVGLLKALESTPGLYFSYDVDLTLNADKFQAAAMSECPSIWKHADDRFLWNRKLMKELIDKQMEPYILPVIQGSFQTIDSVVKGKAVTVTLIARRSMRRAGTRMWRRGADLDGNVANFVETEQILESQGYFASYTQLRGSIPVLWEQIVDLTYKPKIKTINYENTQKAVEKHFDDLHKRYGDVVAIDLINQQGSEGVLSIAFGESMLKISNNHIRYLPFDFHKICGHIHFERLSILYNQILEDLTKHGYHLRDQDGNIFKEQKGVVRTNCIDCLDRTNVTQSLLGRKALEAQLQRIGIFESTNTVAQFEALEAKFKFLWADHGDDVSIQYSGTGALKGDFVRFGRRTIRGLLQDGFNAAARYYLNNFRDGNKQDSIDLVAGSYEVGGGDSSRLQITLIETVALPGALVALIAGAYFTSIAGRQLGSDVYQYLYTLLLAGVTGGIAAGIRSQGRYLANRPRLCKTV